MASTPNTNLPSTGTSSPSTTVLTPTSSTTNTNTAAASSYVGSNNTTTGNQLQQPSYQLLTYLAQPATQAGSLYGRFAGRLYTNTNTNTVDPYSRIGSYTIRAQRNIDRFEDGFERRQ